MSLVNEFLTSNKIIKSNTDSKLPVNIELGTNCRKNSLRIGADQIRILLFRECERRGRQLLFDSVTAGKNWQKFNGDNARCPRNGNGLPQEHEKEACDNVSLLSELVFGTVAMTYRGPLSKIHTLDSPRCLMCTKVFPAPDNSHRKFGKGTLEETIGNSVNIESNSSNGSSKNKLLCPCPTNFSGNSLRKSSTFLSTCSTWNIDVPLLGSSQSLESRASSGSGSFTCLRRRWLRAISMSLNHSQSDDIFGFQAFSESTNNRSDYNHLRHKTRLGLSVIIKLTPGQERLMENRLLEHAVQLEAIMNRLCYTCIESKSGQLKKNIHESKGLIQRLHQQSIKCTLWLIRLLVTSKTTSFSIWHEILLNSTICTEIRINKLHHSFKQMCQLLCSIDTKSTNFFLSTVVTAVLTYHIGWVNTVMSSQEQIYITSMNKTYFGNPLWTQLGDLYGTLGNPSKLVHTIIAGSSEKSEIINSILTFLSYFIRSSIVEKSLENRLSPEVEVLGAIKILEQKKKQFGSSSMSLRSDGSHRSSLCRAESLKEKSVAVNARESQNDHACKNTTYDMNIPKLEKSSDINRNLDLVASTYSKTENNFTVKLDLFQDDLEDIEKFNNRSSVKIIVSSEKNIPRDLELDDIEKKVDWRNQERYLMEKKRKYLQNPRKDSQFEATKSYASGLEEAEVLFSHVEYAEEKQNQVVFTLGGEDKMISQNSTKLTNTCNCEKLLAFTRVPSTSAQLPEGVLRKILQRNFPESSKSIQRPSGSVLGRDRPFSFCLKCMGNGNYEGSNGKLLLETPTNATEVSRTCGNSVGTRGARVCRVDSLEKLLEANEVIELPMPRSSHISQFKNAVKDVVGFTTLLRNQVSQPETKDDTSNSSGYTSGLVIQGLIKKSRRWKNKTLGVYVDGQENGDENEHNSWISDLGKEVNINVRFPMIDQSVSEALCIVADTDNWQVGVISNNMSITDSLPPVGMSRLVSNMLETFVYLWTKYHSPAHCFNLLECKLREMWLQSEALANFLMRMDVCDINLTNVTTALDLDAADIPLLLAVATTHSPQITQRVGLTFT